MNARQKLLAVRREEIIEYLAVLQKRRGLETTIELEVLAAILAAKFRALRNEFVWFICEVLTQEQRTRFRVVVPEKHEAMKPIKPARVNIGQAVREECRSKARATREGTDREVQRRKEERSVIRLERERLRADRLARRETKRIGRARIRFLRACSRLEAVYMKVHALSPVSSNVQKSSPFVKTRASSPKPVVIYTKPPGERQCGDINRCVERAIRAIRGVLEINNENVIKRAVMYGDFLEETLKRFVTNLPKSRRGELGFSDAVEKKKPTMIGRPMSPSLIGKGY